MKKHLIALSAAFLLTANAADLANEDDKISYSIGTQIGSSLKSLDGSIALNKAVLFEAIEDVLGDKKLQLTDEQMSEVMQSFAKKRIEAEKKKAAEAAGKNREEGKKFLEENKKKDGVKVTESGLQYKVIKEGTGKKPTADDTVKVHYTGTLPDGTVFDSSVERGEPVEFPLKGVIPGWTEGVQLMSVGSKYEFVIPSELAYGERGPGQIGPERVLKFVVELLEVKDAKSIEDAKKKAIEELKKQAMNNEKKPVEPAKKPEEVKKATTTN